VLKWFSSPARLQSVRESVENYLDNTDCSTDSLALEYFPKIAKQACLDVMPHEESFTEVVSHLSWEFMLSKHIA
jgi:hypothetical protein